MFPKYLNAPYQTIQTRANVRINKIGKLKLLLGVRGRFIMGS